MNVTIEAPDAAKLHAEANDMYEMATCAAITSPALYAAAAEDLKSIKAAIKQLDEQRKSIVRPLDEAKKRTQDLFNPAIKRLEQAEADLKTAMLNFQRKAEQIARQERARVEAAAAAEQTRLQMEADKRKSEAKALQDEAAKNPADIELAVAASMAEARADVLDVTAGAIFAPAVRSEVPKIQGVSTRVTYSAECEDILKLAEYVLANPHQSGMLLPNEKMLNGMAVAMKDSMQVPGVRLIRKESIAAR